MFARSSALVLAAVLSAAAAWPIFFYETNNCNHYPVFTLEEPPHPNDCNFFGKVDIQSYSGGTKDAVQKLLLYSNPSVCYRDAAHHTYFNSTITNSTNLCVPFKKSAGIPRAYVLIEEILPAYPAEASSCDDDVLRIQK